MPTTETTTISKKGKVELVKVLALDGEYKYLVKSGKTTITTKSTGEFMEAYSAYMDEIGFQSKEG